MGTIIQAIPFVIYPTIVLVSGAIGVYLLVSSREDLTERYFDLVYSITNHHPDEYGSNHQRYFIWSSRALGGLALAFSLLMAVITYFKFLG